MPKLLALDLDGTTFGENGTLSEKNRCSLEAARRAGAIICFVTGRKNMRQIRHVAGLADYILLSNGGTALAMPGEEKIFTTLVNPADMARMIDFCNEQEIVLHVLTEDYWGVNFYTEQVARQERSYENKAVLYRAMSELPVTEVDGFVANGDCRVIERFIAREGLSLCCVQTSVSMVDVMPAGINKWRGVQRIAQREQIPVGEIIAAGNYYNDLEMIMGAAIGVAVRNSPEDVRMYADYVTDATNCEDAVAELIERFVLPG